MYQNIIFYLKSVLEDKMLIKNVRKNILRENI